MNAISQSSVIEEIKNHPSVIDEVPYRHFFVRDFFHEEFHQALCNEFEKIMDQGFSEYLLKTHFSKFGSYDAYYWLLPPKCGYPLNFFYQPAWKDYFESIFDIPLTCDVVAEFHHHKIGSRTGFVHNDYNVCCFTEQRLENGVNPWYYFCNYDPRHNDMASGMITERMRSIALIYYMNNEPWFEGDGGETALYKNYGDVMPARKIQPHSNSLLAFEISPTSYHTFLHNSRIPRNSLIMWFHSDKQIKMSRHNNTPPVSYS